MQVHVSYTEGNFFSTFSLKTKKKMDEKYEYAFLEKSTSKRSRL